MILIVSENQEIRETTAAPLASMDETIETASTTQEALGKASAARVVVVDLTGGGIDGSAFLGCPHVVVLGLHEELPVVIGSDRYPKSLTLAHFKEAVRSAA